MLAQRGFGAFVVWGRGGGRGKDLVVGFDVELDFFAC